MKPKTSSQTRIRSLILALLIALGVLALVWFGMPYLRGQGFSLPDLVPTLSLPAGQTAGETITATDLSSPTLTESTPTATTTPLVLVNEGSPEEMINQQGLLVLSLRDGFYNHLFLYHPLYLPLTRLTDTPWDDITPALSPDGTRLAYSSRANGYWDLFMLNLATGERTRLTDTPEYEASPSWSPDGQWLAYERFNGANLEIFILQISEAGSEPIQLTDHPGIDRSPAWAPQGRQIAFTSTRSGDEEIWLADLDKIDDRYHNLSHDPDTQDRYPVWSRDGSRLAWGASEQGSRQIMVWDSARPELPGAPVGEGDLAAWSPDGSLLFAELRAANQAGLTAYQVDGKRISLPYSPLPGNVSGMAWVGGPPPEWVASFIRQGNRDPLPVLSVSVLSRFPIAPAGRMSTIELEDVTAPYPRLHDAVNEAFDDLRKRVGQETGWDALSSLENAFVPLTTPPLPSMRDDWSYTGRAFSLNPLLMSAGWMAVTREDFNGQTFWRVYLKARYQDGSMGAPLPEMAWDLNSRFSSDTRAYENGGQLAPAPSGYWIDLTEITARYAWERLPSHTNWRSFYPSIRYNQFVITGGLDWHAAMAEIYPPEALATPTPLPTYTLTPSSTPKGTVTVVKPTSTSTPTVTQNPTRRPTWTPLP